MFTSKKKILRQICFSVGIISIIFLIVAHNLDKKEKDILKSANVILFNLSKNLSPPKLYDQIKCRRSIKFVADTMLCIHPLEKDVWVSQSIWNDGFWEGDILNSFTDDVDKCKDCVVLDVGSNIGQYALFSAAIGRQVIAVEPFYDNILRIHKASHLEQLQSKITLIQNGISNMRNQKMELQFDPMNIGGQYLSMIDQQKINKHKPNKYIIETILFDDLINFMPTRARNVIIKIDIEGFETYAFEYSKIFFDKFNVKVIYMEWNKLKEFKEEHLVNNMIQFFMNKNLRPYSISREPLNDTKTWKNWPHDIVWRKLTD